MVHFTRACKTLLSENNKTRLTFEKQQEKNKNIICRPWSVRIEKNCALGLEHGPRPAASGRTQDLWHSFSQYGPPGRQIIYISSPRLSVRFIRKVLLAFVLSFRHFSERFSGYFKLFLLDVCLYVSMFLVTGIANFKHFVTRSRHV